MVERTCTNCGDTFQVPYPSSNRTTCTDKCRRARLRRPRKTRADKGTRKSTWVEATCDYCGRKFEAPRWRFRNHRKKGWKVYHSVECKERAGQAGRPPGGKKAAPGRRVMEGPGSRYVDSNGYIRVYLPPKLRPPGARKRSQFFEHRFVMSQILGRWPGANESIHHINGDKTDNRPENLQLRSYRHGKGHALRCRSCGSQDIESIEI